MIDHLRPGSAAALQSRAVVLDTPPGAPPPKSADADAILGGRVDASVAYRSGRDRYARLLPDAMLMQFPPEPRGSAAGAAILSPEGQRIMAQRGFRPVALPSE